MRDETAAPESRDHLALPAFLYSTDHSAVIKWGTIKKKLLTMAPPAEDGDADGSVSPSKYSIFHTPPQERLLTLP